MKNRIYNDKVDLDYKNISDFFNARGKGKQLKSKYNYVLFQDDNPELANKRDEQEKVKISKILNLKKGNRVLDIGCGIGRWGEYLLETGLIYIGIDSSDLMINLAKENLKDYSSKQLFIGKFQDIKSILQKANIKAGFDEIFVNGVFMNLNDKDYEKALKDIFDLAGEHCELYLKESMGKESRLTLNQIYSECLTQNYSAIYRSIEEYRITMTKTFGNEYEKVIDEPVFSDELNKKNETIDYYFIWRK